MNVEADQLTNEIFEAFSPENGVHLVWENLKFPMINLLANFAESLSKRSFRNEAGWREGQIYEIDIGMSGRFQLGILVPFSSLLLGYGFFYE